MRAEAGDDVCAMTSRSRAVTRGRPERNRCLGRLLLLVRVPRDGAAGDHFGQDTTQLVKVVGRLRQGCLRNRHAKRGPGISLRALGILQGAGGGVGGTGGTRVPIVERGDIAGNGYRVRSFSCSVSRRLTRSLVAETVREASSRRSRSTSIDFSAACATAAVFLDAAARRSASTSRPGIRACSRFRSVRCWRTISNGARSGRRQRGPSGRVGVLGLLLGGAQPLHRVATQGKAGV